MAERLSSRNEIKDVLKDVSPSIIGHIDANPSANYQLFFKSITHSDLCGGKRTSKYQGNDKNILYYLTVQDMDARGFEFVAHQSNLLIPRTVYNALSISAVKNVVIDFKLVNDSATYFTEPYTRKVVEILNKDFPWGSQECIYSVEDGSFTSMHMTYGDHGVGTSNDHEFQALRKNIFAGDVIYFLIEDLDSTKNLYILLSKNEEFYKLLSLPENNQVQPDPEDIQPDPKDVKTAVKEVRTEQDIWKDRLADEMKKHASSDTEVFCPLTGIRGSYENLKMLFIGSHIKAYAECEEHEKYDVNNGLLLTAGADSLFDKYMITIGEDKEIIFSFLINDKVELKKALCLDQKVFKQIFIPERMEYLKHHRKKFFEKEQERRLKMSASSDVALTVSSAKSAEDIMADLCASFKRDELQGSCLASGSKGTFLIAPYENILHKKWIIKERIFNTSITKDDMQNLMLNSFIDTIVLYDKFAPGNLVAYAVKDCMYFKGEEMAKYPLDIDKDQSYLVYLLGNQIQVNLDMVALLSHVDSKYGADAISKLIMIEN